MTTATPFPAIRAASMDQVVLDLLESIAMQESALSYILCAESQKMRAALGMDDIDLNKLLEANDSAANMVHAVANLGLILKDSWSLWSTACPATSPSRWKTAQTAATRSDEPGRPAPLHSKNARPVRGRAFCVAAVTASGGSASRGCRPGRRRGPARPGPLPVRFRSGGRRRPAG